VSVLEGVVVTVIIRSHGLGLAWVLFHRAAR
jgi:hypothetical protein